MRSITIFLTLFLFGSSICHYISKRETNINKLLDELLEDYNDLAIASEEKYISVDDYISTSFEKRVSKFIKVKGSFTANDGILGDISTLQRTGDATLTSTPTTITITLRLGLRHLEVYYRNYEATFLKIRVSGDLRLTVETNSLFAQFTFVYEDEDSCSTNLDRIYLEALDGIRVDISGLGPLDWASGKIAEFFIKRIKEDIVNRVETALRLRGERNKNGSLCEFIRNI